MNVSLVQPRAEGFDGAGSPHRTRALHHDFARASIGSAPKVDGAQAPEHDPAFIDDDGERPPFLSYAASYRLHGIPRHTCGHVAPRDVERSLNACRPAFQRQPRAKPIVLTGLVAIDLLDAEGFESGTDTVKVTALIADPEGGWVAGGEIDDGDQTRLTLWHSVDGLRWEEVRVDGLDQPETEEDGESIESLAVVFDMMLVVREATGLDDSRLTLLRGTGGEFQELEPTGLDALELPNSDVIPAVAAVDDQFVLFASVPVDDGDEFGERIPTLFTSPDGETWTATELDGPTLLDPFSLQALSATDRGAIGLTEGDEVLDVWRFTDD